MAESDGGVKAGDREHSKQLETTPNGHLSAAKQNGEQQPEHRESPSKRMKIAHVKNETETTATDGHPERRKGVAPIKPEYLIDVTKPSEPTTEIDDDAAEAAGKPQQPVTAGRGGQKTKGGQNHSRSFGNSKDAIELCKSRAQVDEFAEQTCPFGQKCRYEHDIRKYLNNGKREDLKTFDGKCPLFDVNGKCTAGWKCRFAIGHSTEVKHEDGRHELVLIRRDTKPGDASKQDDEEEGAEVVNKVSIKDKITLRKKQFPTPKSNTYLEWQSQKPSEDERPKEDHPPKRQFDADGIEIRQERYENAARYREAPLKASEKRRLYYGPETPILAPLTTQGNLPFRRLCVSLGCQLTWSEMAQGLPLLQGEKSEWALMKAHESELISPAYNPTHPVTGYDNSKDIKFGAQIAANKPWLALKTTEVLTSLCPNLRAVDLNCGCPVDYIFRQGSGSALLDTPTKLERILRGMNLVSGPVPITVKIRMGTKDNHPTAEKLCRKLILGTEAAQETGEGPAGVAAIALHGRSRQQRYTRSADWEYIASCANLVRTLRQEASDAADTIREPDARDLSASTPSNGGGLPYFVGNGDILSHTDYNLHLREANVDACMVARGALVKPWIFEEIAANQYLDKSASERLAYVEQFVRNGLEYWGSDELGVGTTGKFLLEWLSFSCRYVPVGLLEYLPPRLGDRPPAFRGRSELETLLCSANYKDWIKISEMFLGPAHKDFKFEPKHKSNSYELESNG